MLGQHRHVYIWPPSWQNLRSATFFRAFGYAKLNTLRVGATNENGVELRLANHSVTCTYDVHRLVLQSDIPFGSLGAVARKNGCRNQGFCRLWHRSCRFQHRFPKSGLLGCLMASRSPRCILGAPRLDSHLWSDFFF